jgi:hypothetical protein
MAKGDISIIIPNSHRDEDIGASLIMRILKQAAISRQDWLDSKQSPKIHLFLLCTIILAVMLNGQKADFVSIAAKA